MANEVGSWIPFAGLGTKKTDTATISLNANNLRGA